MTPAFLDTNILVYALGTEAKADRARALLDEPTTISVQCLNEFASVASRKLRLEWRELDPLLDSLRRKCVIVPLTVDVHVDGVRLAIAYRLAIYDAMIVAAALAGNCSVLYSEDMHHGLVVDGRLTIINPFRA